MGKLFDKAEELNVKYSAEEFVNYYKTANVVSTEAISDYMYSIKDSFVALGNFVFDHKSDRALLDAIEKRHETLNVVKRLHFSDLANESVTIPEKFDGYYSQYVKDLIDISNEMVPDTESLLNNLKMAISGFVNEYSEDGVLVVYGKMYADTSDKLIKKNLKTISGYFPGSKSTFKSKAKDVIKNLGEIEGLYDSSKKLEGAISLDKITKISKLTKEVTEMVDVLIEQNAKSGVLTRNTEAKKELLEMIHIGARSVEFISYLYSNTLYFYNALKALSETILVVGKR